MKIKTILKSPIILMILQYIVAITIIIVIKTEENYMIEFIKNLMFYIIIFIIPIFLYINKVLDVNFLDYINHKFEVHSILKGLAICLFMIIIFLISNGFKTNNLAFNFKNIAIMTSLVLAGFFEEIIFRGFYLKIYQEKIGFVKANILTAVLFSLLHFQNILIGDFVQLVMLFIIGLWLGFIYQKTMSIWVPIIVHSVFNILTFVF